jgi:hypothetical protein
MTRSKQTQGEPGARKPWRRWTVRLLLAVAVSEGYSEMADLLRKHGAKK